MPQFISAVRRALNQVRKDTSGAAMTEYVILVGIVGLGSAGAVIFLGVAFVHNFDFVRTLILAPFP